jgi:hypothetical protein
MLRATRIGSGGSSAPVSLPCPGQLPQKPVRQVVEVVQPLAQVGVGHRLHPRARRGLFLLHRRLGAEAARDVLLHPAHPAAGAREHPVGLQHLALFGVAGVRRGQHLVDVDAQPLHRVAQALQFHLRVVGHGLVTTTRGSCSQTWPIAVPSCAQPPRNIACACAAPAAPRPRR